jgi:hypothetical protein
MSHLNDILKTNVELVARAFWRRIYDYRNDHGRELGDTIPIEFSAHLNTAMGAIDLSCNEDGEALLMGEIVGDTEYDNRDIYIKLHRAGYRIVREPKN